jgi:hypothetical protein
MELVINQDQQTDVASRTTEELLAELASSLEVTARHLVRLAAVWSELERRGVDLSKLRSGLRLWLPMIAAGKLAAEAVVQFAGQSMLLRALAELPLQRQRDLARGEEVVVVTLGPAGGFASEKIPAHRLIAADIGLVFDKGHIRTAEEQIPLLQDRSRRRQREMPTYVRLKLAPTEYQTLATVAKAQHVQVATLVINTLRKEGLLGR